MNDNVKDLLDKYVEKFEYLNNKDNREFYKWELAQAFQKLDLDSRDFVSQLKWLLKKSSNLIDSSTYPFYAIIKYAEKEPETVREMFKGLFAPTGDLVEKTSRIYNFVDMSERLRKKYHFSQRYENNLRSVLQYLFFRNPDENYMYKATEAQEFADCFEYYDFWGPMKNFRLEKYYKMCDMLVEEIKNHPALVATNKSRYDMPGLDLHPDENLHLLAFDIIYSAYHYGFYTGMNIKPIDSKARKLHKERVEKAKCLLKELEIAQRNYDLCREAQGFVDDNFVVGTYVDHKIFGIGEIIDKENELVTISFDKTGEVKTLNIYLSYANGIVSQRDTKIKDNTDEYKRILLRGSYLADALKRAEIEIEPYLEYLE